MKKFNKDKYLRKLKLKRYWQNNSRYFYIGIPCLLCLVLGIYFAYSKFFVSSEEDVVRTTVGEFIYGDIIVTPYVDGQYSSTFSEKKTGINVEKVVCDNGVTASWDEDKLGLYATNLSKRTKCSVYFVTPASCGINDNVSCINSREGLATLANEVNNGDNKSGKIIYLTSDLDLGGKFDSDGNALDGNISWTPIGISKPFSGTFDGNGHIISNMYVNRPNADNSGLFGWAENGLVKNLGVVSSYVTGSYNQGGIVGISGTILNCFSKVTIKGNARTAGVCGTACLVKNSYNLGNVTNGFDALAGGISGGWGIIKNCYNVGDITSNGDSVGGIVGWSSKVYNSYNLGKVIVDSNRTDKSGGIMGQGTVDDGSKYSILINNFNAGTTNGGGIIGKQYAVSDYQNFKLLLNGNYFLTDTAKYGLGTYRSNQGAEPLPQDEMPSVISVINGDNAFVEDTNNINNGYPILKWQAERENN